MPHIHEKVDFTVTVFIVHAGKVLMRMHEKYHVWTGPGGHVEPEEDPNQTAVREAKEETGLDINLFDEKRTAQQLKETQRGALHYKELIAPAFLNRHHTGETHEHVDLVYFATAHDNALSPRVNERETKMQWFSTSDLDDPQYGLEQHIHYYAHAALKALSI